MRSVLDDFSAAATIVSAVVNDDTEGTGTGVDLAGYEGAMVFVNVGISGDTLSGSLKSSFSLQESDDNSTFTDVAAADIEGSSQPTLIDDAAEDPALIAWGYTGSKRYLRVLDDTTGTHTNGTPVGAVVVRRGKYLPA